MSDQARTLPPGSVKDRQISGQAKIGHGKLAQVADAQVLVGGSNKKLSAQTVSGDATLANDGTLTLDDAKLETRVKAVLTNLDIEAGSQKNIKASEIKKIYEEIPGVNRFTSSFARDLSLAGSDNTVSTLMKRDDDGSVEVKVDRFTAGTSTAVTGASGILNHTTQTVPTQVITAASTGNCSDTTNYVVEHSFGSMPLDVKVFEGSSTTEEVEVEVESTTTQSTIKFSPPGPSVDFTIKILGVKA